MRILFFGILLTMFAWLIFINLLFFLILGLIRGVDMYFLVRWIYTRGEVMDVQFSKLFVSVDDAKNFAIQRRRALNTHWRVQLCCVAVNSFIDVEK